MTPAELLAITPGADAIPLAVLRGLVGWSRENQRYAVAAGLIRPLPGRGRHGGYRVTTEDAITILAAAALAPGAGVAVATMLRTIQIAGLSAQDLADAVTGTSGPAAAVMP